MLEILSGPVAEEFLVYLMTLNVSSVVASVTVGSSVKLCLRLVMCLCFFVLR